MAVKRLNAGELQLQQCPWGSVLEVVEHHHVDALLKH